MFRDDPRIDRLETLAALLSIQDDEAEEVFARQRGNLRREDRRAIERYRTLRERVLVLLREIRSQP